MNRKDEYIRLMLVENIDIATKTIDELYVEIEELRKLPNDCTGIMIEDMVCENPDYKIDLLTNHLHVIGYHESLRSLSKELLQLNSMNKQQFEEYLIEQEEIEEHNRKEFERIDEIIKNITNNNI